MFDKMDNIDGTAKFKAGYKLECDPEDMKILLGTKKISNSSWFIIFKIKHNIKIMNLVAPPTLRRFTNELASPQPASGPTNCSTEIFSSLFELGTFDSETMNMLF